MKNLFCLMTLSIECGLNGTCHQKPEGPLFSFSHPSNSVYITVTIYNWLLNKFTCFICPDFGSTELCHERPSLRAGANGE